MEIYQITVEISALNVSASRDLNHGLHLDINNFQTFSLFTDIFNHLIHVEQTQCAERGDLFYKRRHHSIVLFCLSRHIQTLM